MVSLSLNEELRHKMLPLTDLATRLGAGTLDDYIEPQRLHIALNAFNGARLQPKLPDEWESDLPLMRAAEMIEARFVEAERARAKEQVVGVPRDPAGFVEWFLELKASGPGQFDPFFDYLAEQASRAELQYFIKQEFCGEIGFEDLIALTQVRFPERPKLELARNFWDEQGRGRAEDLHGPMFVAMARELGVENTPDTELLWETLALANLLTALACNRRYAWHSLGALAVVELTSPTRASRVAQGLARVGLSERGCRYFRLHTTVDVEHSQAMMAEVFIPLLEMTPDLARPLAEGAMLRLNAGLRLIQRYRAQLKLDPGTKDAQCSVKSKPRAST
jgi:pyrroloquinoline quinone (PQQ) biosynthesis protein C